MADTADHESVLSFSSCSHSDDVEVMFEDEQAAIHRRRSSIVAMRDRSPERPRGPMTNCIVHQLLEGHRVGAAVKALHQMMGGGGAKKEELSAPPEEVAKVERHRQSRLLSKRELSEMSSNIRELSKSLAHIKLKLKVQNIFVLGKAHDPCVVQRTRDLTEWLLEHDPHHRVYVENTLEHDAEFDAPGLLGKHPSFENRVRYWDDVLCAKSPQIFDVVVALGGDGTVLYASHLFQRIVPPVLAFALGSLGFLTKFDFGGHRHSLSRVFAEGFNVSLRLRFEATIMRNRNRENLKQRDIVEELIGGDANGITHDPEGSFHILNEVVLDRGPNATMITIEVFGDNEYFTMVQADGVCLATPTGSTAYNLAAGGALCHPDNPVMLLTAICAHTLSFRPVILPDTIVLRLAVPYDARTNSWASFDGRERVELLPGDYVTISASRYPFPSVLPPDRTSENWIDSISRTLNWNSRQRQKEWHP